MYTIRLAPCLPQVSTNEGEVLDNEVLAAVYNDGGVWLEWSSHWQAYREPELCQFRSPILTIQYTDTWMYLCSRSSE
jgi:hypothetical protein